MSRSKTERVSLGNGVTVTVTYRSTSRRTSLGSEPQNAAVGDLRDAARRLRVAPCDGAGNARGKQNP